MAIKKKVVKKPVKKVVKKVVKKIVKKKPVSDNRQRTIYINKLLSKMKF